MPLIMVTGANGQLGTCLQQLSVKYPQFEFHFSDRDTLPLDDFDLVNNTFAELKPAFCINAAAYTAVDKAESDKEAVFLHNADAVGNLAKACAAAGTKFLHISTDYVFDGNGTAPYKETDPVDPVNTYGASKLAGEQQATTNDPAVIIIRTSWVYAAHGNNFVKTMIRLMNERESIGVVGDQFGSPTYALDLAQACLDIIVGGKWIPGVYHFSNGGNISWHQFALAIKERIGSNCVVNSIATSQYPTPAKRPAYSVMDKTKIHEQLGIEITPWEDSLALCLKALGAVV